MSPDPRSLVAGLVLVAAACSPASPPAPDPTPPAAASSHERMLARLQEVAREARSENEYLGESTVQRLHAELDGITDEFDTRLYGLHKALGRNELRLGREDEALEHYLAAVRQLGRFRDVPPEEILDLHSAIGVAYLRIGETRNCVTRHTPESCILPIRGGGIHVDKEPSTLAAHYFTEVLAHSAPESAFHTRARWLLNMAHMTLGDYPQGVPEAYRISPDTFASDESFPRFTNIGSRMGLDSFDLSGGAIGEDFDGDGFLDLMVSTSDSNGPMHYYRNRGDGTFVEATREAGLVGLLGGLNLVQADYDNDGDVDVLVLRGGWFREHGRHPNSLLRNNGDATFTDVTYDAGLGDFEYPTQTAAWADYDNDGDLDVYVGNEFSPRSRHDPGLMAPGQLFRNEGDGTFTDVAAEAGVQNLRYAKSVVWGDYDGDRDPDLYVSNAGHKNRLYRNEGNGTFTDVAEELDVVRPYQSFPAWFWDFDNDGALDLFVSGYGGPRQPADVVSVAASYLGLPHAAELARLYRGDGAGSFVEVAERQNLRRVTLPMGSNFGDLDNDGYLDFYLGTGYPYYEGVMPNVMFRNRGGTGFSDVTTAGGFGHLQKGHGVVFADLDNDGDQDVFEQMGGAYPGDAFGNTLYENPGFDHRWIKIKLVGQRSNRAGLGARIRLDIVEDGRPRTIYKHVNGGGTFGGNPLLRQEIGLGTADRITRLEVFWPMTGRTQAFEDVAAEQYIEVTEDEETYRRLPLVRIRFGGAPAGAVSSDLP